MRIFAGEWVKNVLTRMGMKEGEAIESRMVTRRIEGAQKKVEERNFEIRKNLLEYDEVMDEQRKRVYGYRQRILDGDNCRDLIMTMINDQVDGAMQTILDPDYGAESFAAAAGNLLTVELEPRDFKSTSFDDAARLATQEAQKKAESQVFDAIEENLPQDSEDESEWNWTALAHWSNTRWGTNYRDRDLKKIGRDMLDEQLIADARKAIDNVDLESCRRYLEPDFGLNTACAWLHDKFGVELAPADMAKVDAREFNRIAHQRASAAYDERESEFPVLVGLYRFSTQGSGGQKGLQREGLVEWARSRFDAQLEVSDLSNKQREEIRQLLLEYSRKNNAEAMKVAADAEQRVDALFSDAGAEVTLGQATGNNGKLDDLTAWLKQSLQCDLTSDDLARLNHQSARRRVLQLVEDRYRPEMRKLERQLLLQILDQAWKEHLLTMDHLRSSVGLRGYAQIDPKVEYKREGMRLFETMWKSVANYVTDLIFKMEQLDENFIGSTWVESAAIKEDAPAGVPVGMSEQTQAAIEGSQATQKLEPIRNREEKIPRNAPCPCGSGKKYKNCHGAS
jgi:preprotein translocase subunit SecA